MEAVQVSDHIKAITHDDGLIMSTVEVKSSMVMSCNQFSKDIILLLHTSRALHVVSC